MQNAFSQYQHVIAFNANLPNEASLEVRSFEMGLEREAFSISRTGLQSATLTFWEPDRFEALRHLA